MEIKYIKHEDIDVVFIATPPASHLDLTLMALEAGKHVISEKPMATRWKDGINMVKACDRAGVDLPNRQVDVWLRDQPVDAPERAA